MYDCPRTGGGLKLFMRDRKHTKSIAYWYLFNDSHTITYITGKLLMETIQFPRHIPELKFFMRDRMH